MLPPNLLASRWRRTIAFLIDAVVLGSAVSVLCIPFFEELVSLGGWGRLIGFLISLAYFGCFESEMGHGQTPGKRLLGIKLVDHQGDPLPLGKAMLRTTIFSAPFFLNNLPLATSRTPAAVTAGISLLIFGVGGAINYLLLFNGRTRQGLHDLSVGSYVVDGGLEGLVEVAPIWPRHWIILGGSVCACTLVLFIAAHMLKAFGQFPRLLEDVAHLESIPGVERAGVQDLYVTGSQGQSTRRVTVVTLYSKMRVGEEEQVANKAASLLLQADPVVATSDVVRVVVIRGFDLGIASRWSSHDFEHAPDQWTTHP